MEIPHGSIDRGDLSSELVLIYDEFGEAIVLYLIENFGGGSFYVTTGKGIKNRVRDSIIVRLYNGKNTRELARRYGLSCRQIRSIVAESRKSGLRRPPAKGPFHYQEPKNRSQNVGGPD